MKPSSQWKNYLSVQSLAACAIFISISTTTAFAAGARNFHEPVRPSTGLNSDCDTAIFVVPPPLPADAHFDFIGLYNANAPADGPSRDAIPLVPSDCTDSLDQKVATTSNPDFRAANGFPDPDSRLKNLRSGEVPKAATPDGTRAFLPPEGSTPPPLPPTNSLPVEPMSLGEFRDVGGRMRLKCFANGTAKVRIKVNGYRPNSLVTVWAIWLATPPGAPGPTIIPQPFGGSPNLIPIDRKGRGTFIRELSYCPKDTLANGDQLLVIDLAEHWDGALHGAIPDIPFGNIAFIDAKGMPFTSPIGAGIVTVNRGVINMTLQPH